MMILINFKTSDENKLNRTGNFSTSLNSRLCNSNKSTINVLSANKLNVNGQYKEIRLIRIKHYVFLCLYYYPSIYR